MSEKEIKIFVSYNSKDKGLADSLVKNLQKLSISVWYDAFEIFVGHDITEKVYEGLMSCDYIAVILTKDSVNSPWVKEEINYAKYRSITDNGKRTILPLLYENCEIPPTIATLRYADFRENITKGFNDLARSLGITLLENAGHP
jgi:hypothetical protein